MISSYETPGSSPVPRRMARSMFSRGMLFALASATIVRSRGFFSGSPPPLRAATVNSLMIRVNTLPRLASAAPFLCLIVCHLEWPDMGGNSRKYAEKAVAILPDPPSLVACSRDELRRGLAEALQRALPVQSGGGLVRAFGPFEPFRAAGPI